jgi:hypothetical protein
VGEEAKELCILGPVDYCEGRFVVRVEAVVDVKVPWGGVWWRVVDDTGE